MKKCPWEKIDDFQSYSEFDGLVEWINNQVISGLAEEFFVEKPYSGSVLFEEKWFRHISSNEIWRLVWPDAPFTGIFERVET
jgi:hypothetical protein